MSTKHSSTVILRSSLIWSGLVLAALAVVGALIGFHVAGPSGLVSALIGILIVTLAPPVMANLLDPSQRLANGNLPCTRAEMAEIGVTCV